VNRPAEVPSGATPRVFFGTDYAVVCFYQQNSLKLSVQVFTWIGRWLPWQLDPASAVLDKQGLTLSTLAVDAQADFLAISFHRPNGDLALYLLERDTARPGQWKASTLDGRTTAVGQPSKTYAAQGTAPTLCAGRTFLVVTQMNTSTLSGSYDVLTWRWTTQSWARTTTKTAKYAWITAGPEWLAVLDAGGTSWSGGAPRARRCPGSRPRTSAAFSSRRGPRSWWWPTVPRTITSKTHTNWPSRGGTPTMPLR
jgi:hypothetical protein